MLQEIKWEVDNSHSDVSFKIRHLMISNVRGEFKIFEADITTQGNDFKTARAIVKVKADSIDTGDKRRDEHLKSGDFLDAEKYPHIVFDLKEVEENPEENEFELIGDLKIKDVSKTIKLVAEYGGLVTDPWGNHKAGFTITGTINRKDWGLNWNTMLETGGFLVGDMVKIICELELIRKESKENVEDMSQTEAAKKSTAV